MQRFRILPMIFASSLLAIAQSRPPAVDTTSHTVHKITVEDGVSLEVLDFGGTGRALIFLAGSGFDAHSFDQFAPRFVPKHHVYAITRRGFGASSAPAPKDGNYTADHLAEDVLTVIQALHLDRPVLAGHSLAGQELSSIGSRHPELVSGLIYLDAGYSYALYSPEVGDPILDAVDLQDRLHAFLSGGIQNMADLQQLQTATALLNKDFSDLLKQRSLLPPSPPRPANMPVPAIPAAISLGRRKYTSIKAPALVIYADPHNFGDLYKTNTAAREAVIANDHETTAAQEKAFVEAVPSARLVRIANADHFIFRSNADDVFMQMDQFMDSLIH